MEKTITIRLDDSTYKQLKAAAESEHRSITNFIENAALNYIKENSFVADEEMDQILADKDLLNRLQESLNDIKKGNYRIVE